MAFVMRTGNGAGDYSIFGTDTGGTNAGLHLIVRNRKYYMGFYNNDCASPTGSTLNKWEHVAFNYDGRTMKIYVNGKLTKTCPNKNPFTGTSIVNLGQWAKGRRWVGGIRGAKIYEGVLSAAQIMEASETDGLIYEQTGEATSFPKPIGKAPGLGFTLPAFTAMALVKRTGDGAGDYSIYGTDTGGTNKGLHLIVRNRKYYMGFYSNDCASPTGSTLNRWEHVAFVYGGRAMKIYVNGKLTKTCTNKNPFTGTSTVNIGQWASGRKWVGSIRDAKIYDHALSEAEIATAGEYMFSTTKCENGYEPITDLGNCRKAAIHLGKVARDFGVGDVYTVGDEKKTCLLNLSHGRTRVQLDALREIGSIHQRTCSSNGFEGCFCKRTPDGFRHMVKGCVNGHNIVKYPNKSVAQCAQLCHNRADCKAFEYGVAHGGSGGYKPRDCQLQSSANFNGCNGAHHNLDLYIKQAQHPTCGGNAGGASCKFPFTYHGKTYNSCTSVNHDQPWCYTTNAGKWGNCNCSGRRLEEVDDHMKAAAPPLPSILDEDYTMPHEW